MAISQETIDEVLRVANVYDVINDYINLEKAGSNYKALCPFHSEKTPSFMVSPQKNIFKCFGCGKSGNAVKFLMDYEGISFSEAILRLADRYKIPVKFTKNDEKFKEKNRFIQIAEKIKDFYKDNLKKSKVAKEYIYKRNLLPRTVDFFELGYSPLEINYLLEFSKKEGITIDELREIGILSIKENGRFKDRFAGRLIFPIKNGRGQVVGFGGRKIKENSSPKYINSPETPIYSKSKVLYGLYESRDFLREKKTAVIVEGYFDLISLYQIGIKNVVATLGTALTFEHGKILSKFVNKVILMFDYDKAGKRAVIKAAKMLLPHRIEVFYCPIESGKDPDELAKNGYKVVEEHLKKSKDFLLFLIDRIKKEKDLKKRKDIIDLYLDIISYSTDKYVQGIYIKELSESIGIPIDLLEVKERKLTIDNEEENNSLESLSIPEKIVLKGLLEHKSEILSRFNKFDKITGSNYFLYLMNELLKNEDLDELEIIKNFNIPSNPDAVLSALNRMHYKWLEQQSEIEATFLSSASDEIIKKILLNKKSLYTGGSKKK